MNKKGIQFILIGFCCTVFFSFRAYAGSPLFQNLSTSDYQNALKDISAAWSYTSVSPASPLGHIFGFELGVIAGGADTPNINSLSQSAGAGSIPQLPSGELFGAITVPYGLTVEAEGLPKTTIAGVGAYSEALALKWTFSDLLPMLPLDLDAKAFYSNSEFNFAGTLSGGFGSAYTTFDLTDAMTGAEIEASKKFLFVEPYVKVGLIQARGKMDVSTTYVFLSGTESETETVTGSEFMAGADLNFAFLRVGAEIGSVFGDTRAAAKLSLYF